MAKILVADDNSNIQKMVGLALKDQGIDVVAVGNGEAAVRKISDIKPDLVLADVFMPVRNGYEVCRYVKEDATLSHIPVILLVGAFDPLDEQEAQRVGADGVLKKPFVPPDPLISMVKSALTRAGIPIGNEPPVEKVPEVPAARNAKDLLTPAVSSKLAALSAAPIPEAEAEPIEEFPAPPSAVKIAAGSEPVAFGNLLETPDSEDDAAFMPKPIEEMEAARNWGGGAESDEVAEEEEEEKPGLGGGWRPDGLDEVAEPAVPSRKAKTKDWREEAFHGNSPANISSGRRWTPATTTQVAEVAEVAEAAEAPAVAVSTLESKPSEVAAPFAGDAWAAALASSVEDKIVATTEAPAALSEAAEVAAPALLEEAKAAEPVAIAPAQATEPGNWAAASESAWDLEAKKASLLAATWDAPAATEPPIVAEAARFLQEEAVPAEFTPEALSTPASTEIVEERAAQPVEEVAQATAPVNHESSIQEIAEIAKVEEPLHVEAPEISTGEAEGESIYAAEVPLDVNATQEMPSYAEEVSHYSAAPLAEDEAAPISGEAAAKVENAAPVTASETEVAPAAGMQQLDMDALVARVLAKMNPDVLQKVTQEILKPVIEAIIKAELDAKK